jgi:DNA polymerase-3 subunit gamma/tau
MSWDLKYRPLKFSDVLGQGGAAAVLKARLRNGTALDTSYIFSGGSGMGKTTLARILARAILCQRLDKADPEPCNECENCKAFLDDASQAYTERDAASQGTIDHIRQIVDELPFAVLGAPKRVYLFDECHRLSKDAQDALLKPIEEKLMVGMFATTEPEKVRAAIRSRCEEHTIRRATREEILAWVKNVLVKESVPYEDDAVLTVIDYAGGHIRDVLNRLEMISQGGGITVDRVRDQLNLGLVSSYFEILVRMAVDLPSALSTLDKVCERVTAEEAASGLAEAAMNAFRLANGMAADFTFTDRTLAAKVHEIYGSRLITVTEYFLRSRYTTNVGLVCDIASLAQMLGGGSMPVAKVQQDAYIPPVHVVLTTSSAPQVISSQLANDSPTPSVEPPTTPSVAPKPQEASARPSAPIPAVVPKPSPAIPAKVTADDVLRMTHVPTSLVGARVTALTENDDQVIPKTPAKTKQVMLELNRLGRDERTLLSPEHWRRAFSKFLPGAGKVNHV